MNIHIGLKNLILVKFLCVFVLLYSNAKKWINRALLLEVFENESRKIKRPLLQKKVWHTWKPCNHEIKVLNLKFYSVPSASLFLKFCNMKVAKSNTEHYWIWVISVIMSNAKVNPVCWCLTVLLVFHLCFPLLFTGKRGRMCGSVYVSNYTYCV